MPPQNQSDNFDNANKSKCDQTRKEIYYDGYYYDVTDFIRRHPGGNVIQFYTQPGEDATQAIQQFHFRSFKRIEGLLKTFKKRPAPPQDELGLKNKNLTARHQAMSKDFKQLFEDLRAEGYFEPSYSHVVLRLLEAFGGYILFLGFIPLASTWLAKSLLSLFGGYALSKFLYLMHEAAHKSLTGNTKLDHILEVLVFCTTFGGSPAWWKSQHNRHHAMPQRLKHDVDLQALPLMAFNERAVTSSKQYFHFFMKYQGFLYWTLDIFLGMVMYRFYIHPRCQWRKREYFELVMTLPSYYLLVSMGVGLYSVTLYFYAFFLAVNFAISHSHLEATDEPTHWIEYSLTHTANIRSNLIVDWWLNFLNYQIEHHLFPTMPNFKQGKVAPRVKALAKKHGLEYQVYGYWEAVGMAMKNLYTVGKNVTRKVAE